MGVAVEIQKCNEIVCPGKVLSYLDLSCLPCGAWDECVGGSSSSETQKCIVDQVKGTNGRQKTYEIFHVYRIFYSGFMCQTTVIFWNNERWKSVLNTLAS